jgi:drug/metabolite transporter (DMT)-like permease
MTRAPVLLHWALSACAAAFALNLLLRAGIRLPGPLATLLAATLIAMGVSLLFAHRYRRPPEPSERRKLVVLYAGVMLLLYAILFGLMLLKDEPGPMGQLLFALHYLSYPLALWLCFNKPVISKLIGNTH